MPPRAVGKVVAATGVGEEGCYMRPECGKHDIRINCLGFNIFSVMCGGLAPWRN